MTIAAKFAAVRRHLRANGLIGRETEMHILQTALVARQHVLLYGPPGVAKSMTVNGILGHLPDLAKFASQMYKASPPEQLLGPISIKGMERDEFVRIVSGRTPDVEVAFLDEVARAPRALLPALQSMMVERLFDAGHGLAPVPLMSLIGTCNHVPDDPELEAFFDRFTLKLVVKPPASQQQFTEILKGALARRANSAAPLPAELLITRGELDAIQRAATQVIVPDDVLEGLGELWANLVGVGILPSIRRNVDLTACMQAAAALDNRHEVLIDDMQIAAHSLWSQPDEEPAVRAEVVKFASAWVQEKAKLLDDFAATLDRLGQVQSLVAAGADGSDRATIDESEKSITDHSLKVINEQKKLAKLVQAHIGDAQGRDTSELAALLTQIDAGRAWVSDRILGGLAL